jgi:plasmid stabilization system protein ParE
MKTRQLKVVWTSVAAGDLERIAAYQANESPVRAATIIDRIVERAESLASLPSRGRTPPELRSIGDRSWHELQEPPWRLICRRLDEVVQVHAVLDGRRNLEDILMERMLKS